MGHAQSAVVCSTGWDVKQRNFFVHISSFWSEVLQGRVVIHKVCLYINVATLMNLHYLLLTQQCGKNYIFQVASL